MIRIAVTLVLLMVRGVALLGQDVVMTGDRWVITVQTDTLAMTGQPTGRAPLVLSTGQGHLGAATQLHQDGRHAHWLLPESHLTIDLSLDADDVVMDLLSSETGSCTWPILG